MVQVDGKNEFRVETKSLVLKTDDDGQLQVATAGLNDRAGDITSGSSPPDARRPIRSPGFHEHLGISASKTPTYDQIKVYTITDRPVYRPGHAGAVQVLGRAPRYDQPEASEFAGKTFMVEIRNPKGDKVFTKEFTADAFGGFDGSFELPSDAMLGYIRSSLRNRGGGSFRVEEYKKPEFEVKVDAPTAPVMLGEKVSATIKANYYFGGPVAEAKVKYKITRTPADERWYPAGRWDWLFGPGYWWFAADSSWYPGWSRWGMHGPWPPGGEAPRSLPKSWPRRWYRSGPTERWPSRSTPPWPRRPTPTRTSGTRSRPRSPTSRAARSWGRGPCWSRASRSRVYTWVDRGHYRVGDTIEAGFVPRPSPTSRSPARGRSS